MRFNERTLVEKPSFIQEEVALRFVFFGVPAITGSLLTAAVAYIATCNNSQPEEVAQSMAKVGAYAGAISGLLVGLYMSLKVLKEDREQQKKTQLRKIRY